MYLTYIFHADFVLYRVTSQSQPQTLHGYELGQIGRSVNDRSK